jgi:hypothetical protein
MGGIYGVRRWDGLRYRDMHTKSHKGWFSRLELDREDTQTHSQHEDGTSLYDLYRLSSVFCWLFNASHGRMNHKCLVGSGRALSRHLCWGTRKPSEYSGSQGFLIQALERNRYANLFGCRDMSERQSTHPFVLWATVFDDGILIQLLLLVIIQPPVFFYLKHNVSDTGFCLRLQVEPNTSWDIYKPSTAQTICES